jgi:hypothetical protein
MLVLLGVLMLFFGIDLRGRQLPDRRRVHAARLAEIIGIGMMAAILPLIYVERGDQMVFVLQSLMLLIQRRVLQRDDPARVDAGRRGSSRRAPTSSTASARA